NTSITNRYTKGEVDMLISMNGLPRDWGSIVEQVDVDTGTGSLPVAGHMVAGQFTTPATSVLDIDVKENVEARGEYSSVGERLNGVDLQIKDIANNFTTEETDNEFIIKYNNATIAAIPINSTPQVYGNINCSTSSLNITEGSYGAFTVNLDSAPTTTQVVNISCDNSNISISPNKLSFTAANYSVNQTVTVTATDDTLLTDYTATIVLSSAKVSNMNINVNVTNTDESVFTRCIVDTDLSAYDTADTFTNTISGETFTKDENGKVYIGNSVLELTDINSEGSLTYSFLTDKTKITSVKNGIYGVNINAQFDQGDLGWNAYTIHIGIFYNTSAATTIYYTGNTIGTIGDIRELPDKVLVTWTCRADGTVDYYINGSKVYNTPAPSDWTSWSMLYSRIKNKVEYSGSNFIDHVYVFKGEFTDSDVVQLYESIISSVEVKDI
ncbi:hypothetical protein, partial [Mitsuokella sp.]|uniref:hypothetical protein n=1 Tax=Mitsuokella sp. TaxID=2049034 RepID=UPI002A7FF13E